MDMFFSLSHPNLSHASMAKGWKIVPHTRTPQFFPPQLGCWRGTPGIRRTRAPWCELNGNWDTSKIKVSIPVCLHISSFRFRVLRSKVRGLQTTILSRTMLFFRDFSLCPLDFIPNERFIMKRIRSVICYLQIGIYIFIIWPFKKRKLIVLSPQGQFT